MSSNAEQPTAESAYVVVGSDSESETDSDAEHEHVLQKSSSIHSGHGHESQKEAASEHVGSTPANGRPSDRDQSRHTPGRDSLSVQMVDFELVAAPRRDVAAAQTVDNTQSQQRADMTLLPESTPPVTDRNLIEQLHKLQHTWDDSQSVLLLQAKPISIGLGDTPSFASPIAPLIPPPTVSFVQAFQDAALNGVLPANTFSPQNLEVAQRHLMHTIHELDDFLKIIKDRGSGFNSLVDTVKKGLAARMLIQRNFLQTLKTVGGESSKDVDALKIKLKFMQEAFRQDVANVDRVCASKSAKLQVRAHGNRQRCAAITAEFIAAWAAMCAKLEVVPEAMVRALQHIQDPNVQYLQTLAKVIHACKHGLCPTDLDTLSRSAKELVDAMQAVHANFFHERQVLSPTAETDLVAWTRAEDTLKSNIRVTENKLEAFRVQARDRDLSKSESVAEWNTEMHAIQRMETQLDSLHKQLANVQASIKNVRRVAMHTSIQRMYMKLQSVARCTKLEEMTSAFKQDVASRELQTNMFEGLVEQEKQGLIKTYKSKHAGTASKAVSDLLKKLQSLLQNAEHAQRDVLTALIKNQNETAQSAAIALQIALASSGRADDAHRIYTAFQQKWADVCAAGMNVIRSNGAALPALLLQRAVSTPHLQKVSS
jgi:hypothetical protein